MSVQLYINKSDVQIVLKTVPFPTTKSQELFKKILGNKEVPSCLTDLEGRLQTLGQKQQQLKNLQASSTRDRILSFLATAFLIGVLVAGITCFAIAPPGINVGVGGSLLSLYVIFCELYNQSFNDSKQLIFNDMNPTNFLKVLIGGPFVPTYLALTKEMMLQNEVNKRDENLAADFKEIHRFYQTHKAALEQGLKSEANQLDQKEREEALLDIKKGSEYFAKFEKA
jgi:hypothetical protein